jgi:glycosyltransferase involved in cell wall biosynthesis
MDILLDAVAVARSSRGVRRYAKRVLAHLRWHGSVEPLHGFAVPSALERVYEMVRRGRPDAILWTPCQRGPLFARHHVVTVHDCISIEYTYRSDPRLGLYLRMMQRLLRHAEAVVAISHSTREAILRHFDLDTDKITVVQSGIDAPIPSGATHGDVREESYVLLVTNPLPHKNALAACRGWLLSRAKREGIRLRVIGGLPYEALAMCEAANARVTVESEIDDGALASAYRECLFLLAPSLSEGHDLPVAEALAVGANVLCSDIDVHREFYTGRVRMFDPWHAEAIAVAIDDALDSSRPWFHTAESVSRTFSDGARE